MVKRKSTKMPIRILQKFVNFILLTKRKLYWLLRRSSNRRQRHLQSGFVLPTVLMVSMVVVLLTTAMVFRSFDRSKNATYARVNQAVLNAANPALDRARAKLDALFADPTLPRATPSDLALYTALTNNRYSFGDEERLKLVKDINGVAGIQTSPNVIENDDTLRTAWRFPVDTDNNGKFDSYTLYGIYFRSPTRGSDGKFNRARNPLEARTPPMRGGNIGNQCANAAGTSASLVGDSSWYKSGGKLSKSFFVYTATVPITEPPPDDPDNNKYYEKGKQSFSALEYQQDRTRIPLNNNAAVFQDDLEISPGPNFRMNGRIFTNANLILGGTSNMELFQVSSKHSCFYTEENSKITVGGNVAHSGSGVKVHLFKGFGNNPDQSSAINSNNKSTNIGSSDVAYNDAAYNKRIALMKRSALTYSTTNPPTVTSVADVTQYPQAVKDGFKAKLEALGGSSLNSQDVLAEEIEIYLKNRTRRVPYAEVPYGNNPIAGYDSDGDGIDTSVFASGTINPPDAWSAITNSSPISLTTAKLEQTQPEKQKKDAIENYVGDRVNAGNNLPAFWKKDGKYVTGSNEKQFLGDNIKWTNSNTELRYRTSQVFALPDLGISERNGYWEDAAAQAASDTSPNVGGLRVITGAGIYVDDDGSGVGTPSFSRATYSFLTRPSLNVGVANPPKFTTSLIATGNDNIVVWYDTMPMTGGADEIAGSNRKGDLQMRATAAYHYKDSSYTENNYINRTPTACISSYYDPTNATTAKNNIDVGYDFHTNGRSNNGIVYPAPYATDSGRVSAVASYRTQLNRQARLVFPNGRVVNQPLRDALAKIDASGTRSLVDNSAIDTAICALKILDSTIGTPSNTVIPYGAIKEASFLNPREVKANAKRNSPEPTRYDLELEQRQPAEIRVIDIDLRELANTTIGSATKQEYLLPNSGIIYASRDDALLDLSDTSNTELEKKLLSPTDFKLDPTRRPNGVRLRKGINLTRVNTYREEEKGLILVTNLPAYVKADDNGFNLHRKPGTSTSIEEFNTHNSWSNFYDRDNPNNNFACRPGQTGCGNEGDQWRPATIIADTITALSGSFEDGFRNLGDFDLINNAGRSAINARLKNGFWENNFVTSAGWAGSDGYPSSGSSYLTNGVTPIQRRVNFNEYVMEICRKIPVSQCQPGDWVVGYDANNDGDIEDAGEKDVKASQLPASAAVDRLGAGTTARLALQAADRRYARRVAFKRDTSKNTLVLSDWANGLSTPISFGINSSGQVAEYPYKSSYASTDLPRAVDNALWFRTTNNTVGRPFCNGNNNPAGSGCTSDDRTYLRNKPLYYDGSTKLSSPPTPQFPTFDLNGDGDTNDPGERVRSLNLPASNPASSFTICTDNQGSTTKSSISNTVALENYDCDDSRLGNPLAQIDAVLTDLLALNPNASTTDEIVTPIQSGAFAAGTTTTLSQNGLVNVTNIGDIPTNSSNYTTIKLVGNADSIFVLRKTSSNLDFGGGSGHFGVKLELDGVDPNNVFWAVNGNLKWNAVNPSTPHRMAGTFINKGTGSPKWENVIIEGGRILGVNVVPSASNFTPDTRIYAIATTGQPFVVPVLQIHSAEGTPRTDNNNHTLNTSGKIEINWIQKVLGDNEINATFVAGNSPGRPAEGMDDFENFVRFVERWTNDNNSLKRKLTIKGSFIQLKRSAFGTGPKAAVLGSSNYTAGELSLFGYSNTGYAEASSFTNTTPYYEAPERQWGFDVAILSQPPDLFAQKFTLPPTALPDEYFRQVDRTDDWVKTLLCAAKGSGTSYSYTVDASDRPTSCPSLSSYND